MNESITGLQPDGVSSSETGLTNEERLEIVGKKIEGMVEQGVLDKYYSESFQRGLGEDAKIPPDGTVNCPVTIGDDPEADPYNITIHRRSNLESATVNSEGVIVLAPKDDRYATRDPMWQIGMTYEDPNSQIEKKGYAAGINIATITKSAEPDSTYKAVMTTGATVSTSQIEEIGEVIEMLGQRYGISVPEMQN